MRKIGWQHVESTGIIANHSIAIAGSLFRQASGFGDADASNNWAVCLAEGAAASRDETAAAKLFCLASKGAASASAAFNNLGKCAALAMGGIESDPKSAFGLFEIARALHRDNTAAVFNLAMCLREGLGCPRNKVRCFELLTEAAGAHETKPTAMSALCLHQLGICHRDGVGTPKNLAAAFAWFTRAAQDGCAEAMNNVGVCCRDAVGTPKDNASARAWFQRASEGGSRLGVRNLAMM
jgi:hypothetical protein